MIAIKSAKFDPAIAVSEAHSLFESISAVRLVCPCCGGSLSGAIVPTKNMLSEKKNASDLYFCAKCDDCDAKSEQLPIAVDTVKLKYFRMILRKSILLGGVQILLEAPIRPEVAARPEILGAISSLFRMETELLTACANNAEVLRTVATSGSGKLLPPKDALREFKSYYQMVLGIRPAAE